MNDTTKQPDPSRAEYNDTAAAIEAGKQIANGVFTKVPGLAHPLVFKHRDFELLDTADHLQPKDFRSNARFDDLESFIQYVNQYKQAPAHVFAKVSPSQLSLRAILSYEDRDGKNPAPDVPVDIRRQAALAHFEAVESEELKAWRSRNANSFTQGDMAEWLDMRAADIREPAAALILEMVQNFESKRDVHFKSVIRLNDGSVSAAYEDKEKNTKAAFEFPSEMTLLVPLFRHMPKVELKLKLRYRVNEGTLRLSYHIYQLDAAFDDEIKAAVERVQEKTGLPVYLGDLAPMPELFKTA
jgi:uncharacterized protein YfdQ (DUF2303 family)